MSLKIQSKAPRSTGGDPVRTPTPTPRATPTPKASTRPVDAYRPAAAPVPTPPPPDAKAQIAKLPLSDAEKLKLTEAEAGKYGEVVQAETRKALAAVANLPPEAQAKALGPIAEDPSSMAAACARYVVTSPAWAKLDDTQRAQLCNVIGSADTRGLLSLTELCRTDKLLDKDSAGNTLVANLSALATQPLNAAIEEGIEGGGVTREEILSSVLNEVARPYNVNQGFNLTCTATAMQYELARDQPAEYARLMAGLTGTEGKVEMRGGGTLELQKEYLTPATWDDRSPSEVMFQSAAMEYANGFETYDAKTDTSTRLDGTTHGGLFNNQQDKLLGALFGTSYKSWDKSDADEQLEFLKQYQPGGTNPPVILNLALPYNHALTFERAENGRIYFRDPYGPTADPDGTVRGNGVRVEDRSTGLYSVTEEEYKEMILSLHVPKAEVARFQGPLFPPFRWPFSFTP
ncbi:MAG: hypothetical protein ACYC8T_17125 [Myxococcaceae bacterium]